LRRINEKYLDNLRKELRSYFVSPVAKFCCCCSLGFWLLSYVESVGYFVKWPWRRPSKAGTLPDESHEQVIRPALSNINVIGLFFIP